MYDWVLNTPLEGFAQDAPTETTHCSRSLTGTAWQNYHQ